MTTESASSEPCSDNSKIIEPATFIVQTFGLGWSVDTLLCRERVDPTEAVCTRPPPTHRHRQRLQVRREVRKVSFSRSPSHFPAADLHVPVDRQLLAVCHLRFLCANRHNHGWVVRERYRGIDATISTNTCAPPDLCVALQSRSQCWKGNDRTQSQERNQRREEGKVICPRPAGRLSSNLARNVDYDTIRSGDGMPSVKPEVQAEVMCCARIESWQFVQHTATAGRGTANVTMVINNAGFHIRCGVRNITIF